MPHKYFSQGLTPASKAFILEGEEAHHMAVVMRAKVGERMILCDGRGNDYEAAVSIIGQGNVHLEINSFAPSVSEPSVRVILYVGYPKQDKLEIIIQKAVELGAAEIVPFFSRYCVATPKKEDQKNARYLRIAAEAAKQCGRGILPCAALPLTYKQMLAEAGKADCAFFCYEAGGEPLHSRLSNVGTLAIITGSEGGFSAEEARQAAEAGCVSIGLGPRILRCETAPLAALAAVMTLTGNLE